MRESVEDAAVERVVDGDEMAVDGEEVTGTDEPTDVGVDITEFGGEPEEVVATEELAFVEVPAILLVAALFVIVDEELGFGGCIPALEGIHAKSPLTLPFGRFGKPLNFLNQQIELEPQVTPEQPFVASHMAKQLAKFGDECLPISPRPVISDPH